ncbi:glycoside hydrolase family 5 protein [Prevotella sp. HUN102]|uniref:glycoside hydrolase family 5 protein n=1 Tax=Prevotella sp. HUN102 TaxID=1392486 RepID=UPI001E2C61AE|nr:glycoside hydrolase family 5 protein [Prevotella sp. HUN102]
MLGITAYAKPKSKFVTIDGVNLIQPNGKKLFIKGTNLGNWVNPEGYMFGFQKTNSYWMIDQMLAQLVGPDETAAFWKEFKQNYITRKDIEFIAAAGANTIRLPFNYKSFTDEDYMGINSNQDGFALVDSVVTWCRDNHLYLILDMHDCPGGQTGDNIDNSYGYPWLFVSEESQKLFCRIWLEIAARYKDEPVILGYDLMNEPIATYFEKEYDKLNPLLEPLYKRVTKEIRKVDRNHIIMLGGAQWNGNFKPFTDWKFDDKIMYTCHRYGAGSSKSSYQDLIDFRDKTGLPMYMGEIGHNTDEWQEEVCKTLEENNIGYTFWPYKKVDNSCFNAVKRPVEWDSVIVKFAESDRSTYKNIRENRPDQAVACRLLREYLNNIKVENCTPQVSYIKSLRLK